MRLDGSQLDDKCGPTVRRGHDAHTRGWRLDGEPDGEDDIDAMGNNVVETCRVPVQSVYDMLYERFPTGHRRQHRKMNENLADKDTCNVNSRECPTETDEESELERTGTGQSGPESVMRGSAPASWCARGLAQYILNVRAAELSGPEVLHAASHAFLAQALALAKSET